MTRYGQFCAVARSLEVLGERWTLLVVRELLLGATTFTEIRRGLPRIPRATLSSRLNGLAAAGVIESTDTGYALTGSGRALGPVLQELARWATVAAAAELTKDHLDTAALTWDIHRRIDRSALPPRLIVIALDFTDRRNADRWFWLHLSPTQVDLCRQDTGAPVDIWIAAPTEVVTRWWLGELTLSTMLRHPEVSVSGDRVLRRQMDNWFRRYLFTREALDTAAG